MSKKAKVIYFIIGFLILWNMMFFPLLYLAYMNRSNYAFSEVLSTTRKSVVLNQKLGYIKEVKPNNFMQWISKKKGKDCVKVIIESEKGKYKACVIIQVKDKNSLDDLKVMGYFIGDKKYSDKS